MRFPETDKGLMMQVIDCCLQNRNGMSTKSIMDRCNKAIEGRGGRPCTAMNTIRNYIDEIRLNHGVKIDCISKGREKRYRYRDYTFSIYKAPLSAEENDKLVSLLETVAQFAGRPQLEWLKGMMQRFLVASEPEESRRIVAFDENTRLKGQEFFEPAFDAIRKKYPLRIRYKNFKGREFNDRVHPYFLKQFNNRWFLFLYNERTERIYTYALDRIISMETACEVDYIPCPYADFAERFNDIVGVTDPKHGAKKKDVILRVKRDKYPYIATKPMHYSQTVLDDKCDEEYVVIRLQVYLTPELTNLIMFYADAIEVVSPRRLRREVKEKAQAMIEKYEKK